MDRVSVAMGVAFALIWSSAFTSARIIVEFASPLGSLAVRFLVSGLLGIVIARALGQSWDLTPGQWRATILFGICQNALYLGLVFIAMQTVEASLGVIIASTMPLIVALASWLVMGERLHVMGLAGLVTGFLGVILIMGTRLEAGADLLGVSLCVVGTLALSLATLVLRGATSGGNYMMVVGLQMLVGSAVLFVIFPFVEAFRFTWNWTLALAFSYTTLVPGLLATWLWVRLLNRIGATHAATFHFLNPVFGVATAALLLAETLSMTDIFGVAVVTVGILAVQIAREPQKAHLMK